MNKIALIAGGTSGLGRAAAEALANEGYTVYAGGRSSHNHKDHGNLHFMYLDVTNDDIISSVVSTIIKTHGKIDLLLNSAGIGIAGAIEEIPIKGIHEAFNINFHGTIRMIQLVVPHMRANGGGKIINISSIGGKIGLPFQGIYSATKFAIEGLTEALYNELKPFGVNVCLIQPGDYKTHVSASRRVTFPQGDSPYNNRLKGFFVRLNNNIENSRSPEIVGKLIAKIALTNSPKFRYKSGAFYEKMTPLASWLLPDKLFLKILAGFYKL